MARRWAPRDDPPAEDERTAVLLELGQAYAGAGAPEAIDPLTEIVEHGVDPNPIAAAAIELSGMLFFGGRAAEGATILRRAQERLPPGTPAREQLEVALLGVSYTPASARRDRKSTRLNSSHSQISYAAFCLKKKNNRPTTP